ncbi:MAG: hypothetical protein HSCHL_1843 [Hydrogenibacillus schlegelii]|uniref:Uncharacterized protein n=1 Tax=Hydrogenibacillus schlegelii TaxID=1484 RepID=A0A2T5GFH0_HYDSH|nr:MAG: hypothetical protein HSCHL_1843 [Hydrogenibacillus schlegelii]
MAGLRERDAGRRALCPQKARAFAVKRRTISPGNGRASRPATGAPFARRRARHPPKKRARPPASIAALALRCRPPRTAPGGGYAWRARM